MPHPILIIEDRAEIAARIRDAVTKHDDLEVVGSASTVSQGLELLGDLQPRVVLIDLGLPDGSGVDVIRAVAQADWDCDALVISIFGDEARVIEAIQAGAKGYVLKSGGLTSVCDDILAVIDGGSPISPSIARHLLTMVKRQAVSETAPEFELTGREIEILRAVAQGYKRREIGLQLDISTGTVGNHINSIYRKLNVGSNIQAVVQATKMGLL
ncbi:MAG: response regulator transcription factor [Rhizobiaceae bacterium]|nr:response regulator transcription factor [Rhizobiaceae bacterium]MBL4732147.1 response regulator transcription factor [Rhizobiaceae bacterium]